MKPAVPPWLWHRSEPPRSTSPSLWSDHPSSFVDLAICSVLFLFARVYSTRLLLFTELHKQQVSPECDNSARWLVWYDWYVICHNQHTFFSLFYKVLLTHLSPQLPSQPATPVSTTCGVRLATPTCATQSKFWLSYQPSPSTHSDCRSNPLKSPPNSLLQVLLLSTFYPKFSVSLPSDLDGDSDDVVEGGNSLQHGDDDET